MVNHHKQDTGEGWAARGCGGIASGANDGSKASRVHRPSAKLTTAQVVEVRERRSGGEGLAGLAREFGVSENSISSVALGVTYRNVGGPLSRGVNSPASRRKLTNAQVSEIRERHSQGELSADLAREFGASTKDVSGIVLGRTYRDAGGPVRGPRVGSWNRMLTNAQVSEIREKASAGVGRRVLAEEYGISQGAISTMLRGLTYKDAGGPLAPKHGNADPASLEAARKYQELVDLGLLEQLGITE